MAKGKSRAARESGNVNSSGPRRPQNQPQNTPIIRQTVTYKYRKLRESKLKLKDIKAKDETLYSRIVSLPQEIVSYSANGISLRRYAYLKSGADRDWMEGWIRIQHANAKKNIKRYGKGSPLTELQVFILRAINENHAFTTYDEIQERMARYGGFEDYAMIDERMGEIPRGESPLARWIDTLDMDESSNLKIERTDERANEQVVERPRTAVPVNRELEEKLKTFRLFMNISTENGNKPIEESRIKSYIETSLHLTLRDVKQMLETVTMRNQETAYKLKSN